MPGGDRRGPLGEGPRTGRGLGFCNGYDTPGFTKGRGMGLGLGRGGFYGRGYRRGRGFGRGLGRGFGRGFGRRGWYDYYEPYDYYEREMSEREYLEEEVKNLEAELSAMKKRLETLQDSSPSEEK